ncbi:alpha/beta hydrolase [Candidatus Thiodictyon syntrophicum]|uniref:alpha/beta hydrolase n=1 Tax=Candidatus Thiodictyon syntrophicum TaxID=1166950 RepID=UPI001F41105A|nr:alpha/beta hydrolase [Candidatus Thiodictyon syntrophicum]
MQVRLTPAIDWATLRAQSQLGKRKREIALDLGEVKQLGQFPNEPYQLQRLPSGRIERDRGELAAHDEAKAALTRTVEHRLERSPSKEVMLYVQGFNETFATAAYTAAELCHFLGREDVCTFFTWPASSTGNFLTSYTTTTESADYVQRTSAPARLARPRSQLTILRGQAAQPLKKPKLQDLTGGRNRTSQRHTGRAPRGGASPGTVPGAGARDPSPARSRPTRNGRS